MIIKHFILILFTQLSICNQNKTPPNNSTDLESHIFTLQKEIYIGMSQIKRDIQILQDVLHSCIRAKNKECEKRQHCTCLYARSPDDLNILKSQELCRLIIAYLNAVIKRNVDFVHDEFPYCLKRYKKIALEFFVQNSENINSLPWHKKQEFSNLLNNLKKSLIPKKNQTNNIHQGKCPKCNKNLKLIFESPKTSLIAKKMINDLFDIAKKCENDLRDLIIATPFVKVVPKFFTEMRGLNLNDQLLAIQRLFESEIKIFSIHCLRIIQDLDDFLILSSTVLNIIKEFSDSHQVYFSR